MVPRFDRNRREGSARLNDTKNRTCSQRQMKSDELRRRSAKATWMIISVGGPGLIEFLRPAFLQPKRFHRIAARRVQRKESFQYIVSPLIRFWHLMPDRILLGSQSIRIYSCQDIGNSGESIFNGMAFVRTPLAYALE